MKKVMNKIALAFTFMIALVVGATSVVNAAEEYAKLDNVNISGAEGKLTTVQIEGQVIGKDTYYVVEDTSVGLVLDYKKNNDGLLPFTSEIAVLRCVQTIGGSCERYKMYVVDADVDALRSNNGYTLPLDGFELDENSNTKQQVLDVTGEYVRGTKLSSLNSVYGPMNTIYVLIDYVAVKEEFNIFQWKTVSKVVAQYSQVLKVIDLSEVGGGVEIKSEVAGGKSSVTVTSSVKATTVKYFATTNPVDFELEAETKKLSEVFNEKAGDTAQEITLENRMGDSQTATRKGIVFTTTFEVDLADNTHYYVLAIDETGAEAVLDVSVSGITDNQPQSPIEDGQLPEKGSDSQVGKIILIILVGVLVLAATLVIVQKIVDHKRKLY